ncbi:MAG: hypothetical protein ACLQMT_08130 [Candidatus Acidiferrales bacterium]
MNSSDALRTQIKRRENQAMAAGAAGVILAVICGVISMHGQNPWQQFFRSYLVAYIYWVSIPLGCLAILMLHHLTGGWWGLPIRRILEAGSRTLPLMAALFIPILVGMSRIYPWTQPGVIADDLDNQFKRAYLQPHFFMVRAVVYFAIWLVLAYLLNKWSAEQDRTGDPRLQHRMETLAGPGVILWGLAVTAAAIDWVMSLEPHWFSTIYGFLFIVVEVLAAMSFTIFVLRMLSDYEPMKDSVDTKQLGDLGNLMLTFVLLWAYLSFSQLLIIWAGNLRNEIPWYTQRAFGGWAPIAVILLVLHFFVPFFLLLQRTVKRRLRTLSLVAAALVFLTFLDVYWLVAPSYSMRPHPTLMDLFAVIGIGGVWLGMFLRQLNRLPLLPVHDPRFEGALEHEHGD